MTTIKKIIAVIIMLLMTLMLCTFNIGKNADSDAPDNTDEAAQTEEVSGEAEVEKTTEKPEQEKTGETTVYRVKTPATPEEVIRFIFAYESFFEPQTARGVDVEGSYRQYLQDLLESDCSGSFDSFKSKITADFPGVLEEAWFDFSGYDVRASKLMGSDEIKSCSAKLKEAKSAEELINVLTAEKMKYDSSWFEAQTAGDSGESGTAVSEITKRELSGSEYTDVYGALESYIEQAGEEGSAFLYSASDIKKIYAMSFLITDAQESYMMSEDDCIFVVETDKGCFFASVAI